MDPKLKKILRGISLEIRRLLEGRYDDHGVWQAGDLEQRLNALGVWRERQSKPVEELPFLPPEDKIARRLVDGYLKLREEAGVGREAAVAEFVRESAYTWANRLFALRCMEARGIIDEVILQKEAYGGRSLVHSRYARKNPDACAGIDDALFAVLFAEFEQRARELPLVFDPQSPAVALRPSVAALKRTISLLSGREATRGQELASDEVFVSPDAFGWAYQYWNAEEQRRVFEMVRTIRGAKIERADIVPATQFYTEPYMVKFLVQNSLGAIWMGMHPESKLCVQWEFYVKDADRQLAVRKPVREITILDPAQGSGHFHLEAFDLLYEMYQEEATRESRTLTPREIVANILNHNLFGIDIDGRSVQIATAALWMKAKERAPELEAIDLASFHDHLVATNIRLPKEHNHLARFLQKHPEDEQLRPALELVFHGLEHADELGSLLQIEELVDASMRRLKEEVDKNRGTAIQPGLFEPTLFQPLLLSAAEDFEKWKRESLGRLQSHFETEAQVADSAQAFFGKAASKSLTFFSLLAKRYDVVSANPPYMGSKNMSQATCQYVEQYYSLGKRDLYSAFMCRAQSFLVDGGFMAMVTLGSWLTKDSFKKLRSYFLENTSLTSFVLLGRYAFSEVDPPGLPVLFVIQRKPPEPNQKVSVISICRPLDSLAQAALIKRALSESSFSGNGSGAYALQQTQFAALPGKLILVGLTPQLLRMLIEGTSLENALLFCEPATTGNNLRYVHFGWEVADTNRWRLMSKGGGHKRWKGLEIYRIDWACAGARIKAEPGSYVRNEKAMFNEGITFTAMSRHGISFREMPPGMTFGKAGPGIFRKNYGQPGFLALLNSSAYQFLLRNLSPGASVSLGNVSRLPLPIGVETLKDMEALRFGIAERDVENDLLESDFIPVLPGHHQKLSLTAFSNSIIISQYARSLVALTVDHAINQKSIALLALSIQSQEAIRVRFGIDPAELPVVAGLDAHALLEFWPADLAQVLPRFLSQLNIAGAPLELRSGLVDQVKMWYTQEVSTNQGDFVDDDLETEEIEDDDSAEDSNRLPPENVLEVISIGCGIHPVSAFSLIAKGILQENWKNYSEIKRIIEDRFTLLVLCLIGHRWAKNQFKGSAALSALVEDTGVFPITRNGNVLPFIDRVTEDLTRNYFGGDAATIKREFAEIVGMPLEQWLAGPFYERHIGQFKKRPIAWQIETDARGHKFAGQKKKRDETSEPVFSCLIYYQKLHEDMLPRIRTQFVEVLRGGYETELRTLEKLAHPTPDQSGRKLQLDQWIEELKAFEAKLEQVSLAGFGPLPLRPELRQYAINDALLSLMASWLSKFNWFVTTGPLPGWQAAAAKTELHEDFSDWIKEAFTRLDYFCAAVGPNPPAQETFTGDPTSSDLAPLICAHPAKIVIGVLDLACERWWQKFEDTVLLPLKSQLKQARDEQEQVKEELQLDEVKRDYARHTALADRQDDLKRKIKFLRTEIEAKTKKGKQLRSLIESWTCPEAETWEDWLGTQPLFDSITSLDGKRPPPKTVAEFIAQESAYAPDINDGVRVNIAPLQKAGLLHADVLDSKDVEKAIADRAEWRADERRWVREGKLPQPGWWESKN